MKYAAVFKFNENHDPGTGQFAEGGGGSVSGGTHASVSGSSKPSTLLTKAPFRGVKTATDFNNRADALLKQQGKVNWETSDDKGALADNKQFYDTYVKDSSTDSYRRINNWLRGPAPTDVTSAQGKVSSDVQFMDSMIHKYGVSLPPGTDVYRGIGDGEFPKALDKLREGEHFQDRGFFSTTPTNVNTSAFGKNIMRISLGSRQTGLLIGQRNESEVLFARGRSFKYKGKSRGRNGITYYDVDMD